MYFALSLVNWAFSFINYHLIGNIALITAWPPCRDHGNVIFIYNQGKLLVHCRYWHFLGSTDNSLVTKTGHKYTLVPSCTQGWSILMYLAQEHKTAMLLHSLSFVMHLLQNLLVNSFKYTNCSLTCLTKGFRFLRLLSMSLLNALKKNPSTTLICKKRYPQLKIHMATDSPLNQMQSACLK